MKNKEYVVKVTRSAIDRFSYLTKTNARRPDVLNFIFGAEKTEDGLLRHPEYPNDMHMFFKIQNNVILVNGFNLD